MTSALFTKSSRLPSERSGVFWPSERRLNLRAGIWHGFLCVCLVTLATLKTPPFHIAFNTVWTQQVEFPPFLNTTWCDNKNQDDVFAWLECNRENLTKWGNATISTPEDLYVPVLVKGTSFGVVWLLLLFEVLTSGVHLWLWYIDTYGVTRLGLKKAVYTRLLTMRLQPHRWLEYAFTASIMFWCALALSRVQDKFLLYALFGCNFFLNFCGGAMFEVCAYAERSAPSLTKGVFRALKWWCFFSSWFVYALTLWTFWSAYAANIAPYLELESAPLWRQLFDVATVTNVIITVTFTVFPLIHLYQFWPWRKGRDEEEAAYRRGEMMYIYASFVSKSALVLGIGAIAFMREN